MSRRGAEERGLPRQERGVPRPRQERGVPRVLGVPERCRGEGFRVQGIEERGLQRQERVLPRMGV